MLVVKSHNINITETIKRKNMEGKENEAYNGEQAGTSSGQNQPPPPPYSTGNHVTVTFHF